MQCAAKPCIALHSGHSTHIDPPLMRPKEKHPWEGSGENIIPLGAGNTDNVVVMQLWKVVLPGWYLADTYYYLGLTLLVQIFPDICCKT